MSLSEPHTMLWHSILRPPVHYGRILLNGTRNINTASMCTYSRISMVIHLKLVNLHEGSKQSLLPILSFPSDIASLIFRDGPILLIILLSVSDLIIYLCYSHDLFIMLDHSITSNNTLPLLYVTLMEKWKVLNY